MKFLWHGDHDGEEVGIAMPILDLHLRPLVPPLIVPADDVKAAFKVTAGKPFVLDHTNFEAGIAVLCDWMKSHKQFQLLDADVLPRKVAHPHLSKTPHKHF